MRTVSPPRPPSLSRQGWHERAACRGEDPDLFFPEAGDTIATRKARAICARCPVRVITPDDVRWREAALLWGRGQEPRDGYDQAVFERLDAAVAELAS